MEANNWITDDTMVMAQVIISIISYFWNDAFHMWRQVSVTASQIMTRCFFYQHVHIYNKENINIWFTWNHPAPYIGFVQC